jgi:repressor LexA
MSNTSGNVYNFIAQHIKDKTYPPTIREIQLGVGLLSSSTVHGHIQRLANKGLITFNPSSPRTIKLVEQPIKDPAVKELEFIEDIPDVIEWKDKRYKLIQQ